MNTNSASSQQDIYIKNAGLVILNGYIRMLLERLGLVFEDQFKNPTAQTNTIFYLQYLVTGLTETNEIHLPLNKLLSGLPINHSVSTTSFSPTEEEKQMMQGLLQAVISYWSAISPSSIESFRGTWLVREGMLKEKEDCWELTVEKKTYDLLLNKSPFSFSIIKLPWMPKPLHVNWPYRSFS